MKELRREPPKIIRVLDRRESRRDSPGSRSQLPVQIFRVESSRPTKVTANGVARIVEHDADRQRPRIGDAAGAGTESEPDWRRR